MSSKEKALATEAAVGTVKDVETTELTPEARMSRASEEVAEVLNKYNVTLIVQNVPTIVPAQPRTPESDLKA